jgi:hypothetical protein
MRRALVSVLGIAIAALASGCSLSVPPPPVPAPSSTGSTLSSSPQKPSPPSSEDRASWTCPVPVNVVLPTWARAGWSPPTQLVAHLVGTDQAIVAVPFGWPLRDPAHQPSDHANKILWIPKAGGGPLHIVATEQATGDTVIKELPDGPGPSIVDMPRAGCWRFALKWGKQRDEMFIRYYGESPPRPN